MKLSDQVAELEQMIDDIGTHEGNLQAYIDHIWRIVTRHHNNTDAISARDQYRQVIAALHTDDDGNMPHDIGMYCDCSECSAAD